MKNRTAKLSKEESLNSFLSSLTEFEFEELKGSVNNNLSSHYSNLLRSNCQALTKSLNDSIEILTSLQEKLNDFGHQRK